MDTEDGRPDLIPISLVAHHVFCPRRAWIEAMGEQTDTHQMAVGVEAHAASDDPTASRPDRTRAVDIASERLGVVGRCDTVEWDDAGAATVVEHKTTPVRRRPVVTKPMVVQLALEVGALREAGVTVGGAAVYFTEHRTRVPVRVGDDEVEAARTHVRKTTETLAAGTAPQPLEDDPRCTRCSHAGVCLPDERSLTEVRRRVLVADPDTQVLHLTTPGARASVRAGRIRVHYRDQELASVPLERVLSLVLHGNVDASAGLLRELLWRQVPVLWCSSSGRVTGWAVPAHSPNGPARVRQHVVSDQGHLGLAREFVRAKVGNQATMLRRYGSAPEAVTALRQLQRRATTASSITELFGIEGDAAARYFDNFATMLSPPLRERGLEFTTRTRRPARNPVNAALNFCYGLLLGVSSERLSRVDSTPTPASYIPAAGTSRLSPSTYARSSGHPSPTPSSWQRSTTASFASQTSPWSPEAPTSGRPGDRRSSPHTNAGSARASSIQRSATRSTGGAQWRSKRGSYSASSTARSPRTRES
jgi:CRISP-associated protein Cas1